MRSKVSKTGVMGVMGAVVLMSVGLVGCGNSGGKAATAKNAEVAKDSAVQVPSRKADLTSNLLIEAGKEFLYGGGKDGMYLLSVENKRAPELVVVAMIGEKRTEIARVGRGEQAVHEFADGETAVIVNTSMTAEANATVRVWGATNVGMRYQPVK